MTITSTKAATRTAARAENGMASTLYTHVPSPIGELLLVGGEEALRGLYMPSRRSPRIEAQWRAARAPFAQVRRQLEEYFAGDRLAFEVTIEPTGTPFQLDAWRALREIPYGRTWSYGEQARHIGRPAAVRAVGAANGRNPIAIIVPCHRVIGGDGTLTGFGGGVGRKRFLLDHEAAVLARRGPSCDRASGSCG